MNFSTVQQSKNFSVGTTKDHSKLEVGTPVTLQNQTGINPTKWDKTGVVLENEPHAKIKIKVDGSRRITCRNRRFVKPLYPGVKVPSPTSGSAVDFQDNVDVYPTESESVGPVDSSSTVGVPLWTILMLWIMMC